MWRGERAAVDERVVQLAARPGGAQPGTQSFIGKNRCHHLDRCAVIIVNLLRNHEPEYQVYGLAVRRIEVDRFREQAASAGTGPSGKPPMN